MKVKISHVFAVLLCAGAGVSAQTQYAFVTVDDPLAVGGTGPHGIDGSNVAGYYWDSSNKSHGFVNNASAGWMTIDDPLSVNGTAAQAISGTNIVGFYFDSANDVHGFLYDGSNWTTLDDPLASPGPYPQGGTVPQGVSGAAIVGYYGDSGGKSHGFLYSGGTWTTLDDPAGIGETQLAGVDGTNIVGGYSTHGFLYNGASWTNLDFPGAASTYAWDISGTNITGVYHDSAGGAHGFVFDGYTWTPLNDPLGARGTYGQGISGVTVAGTYYDSSGNLHGFCAAPTPSLAISQSPGHITLSWPYSPFFAWGLLQNSDLNTTNWTGSSATPTNDGTNNLITLPLSTGDFFFRLNHQ